MSIQVYGFGPTRSARVEWILRELGLKYQFEDVRSKLKSDEYLTKHPLGLMPAVEIDGDVIFESVPIVSYIADRYDDERRLSSRGGTRERALQDQWSVFAVTEIEAYLWHSAKNQFVLPEEERIESVIEQNRKKVVAGLEVIEKAIGSNDYMVANRFSIADINLGYPLNWARHAGLTADFPAVNSYLDRLHERMNCSLIVESPVPGLR